MRAFASRTLILLFCFLCLPALSQDVRVVRIGVALLSGRTKNIPGAEARDQLVDALNHYKPDNKLKISLRAVALEAPPGSRAVAEGRDKNCDFLLYSRVEALEKASRTGRNGEDVNGASQG